MIDSILLLFNYIILKMMPLVLYFSSIILTMVLLRIILVRISGLCIDRIVFGFFGIKAYRSHYKNDMKFFDAGIELSIFLSYSLIGFFIGFFGGFLFIVYQVLYFFNLASMFVGFIIYLYKYFSDPNEYVNRSYSFAERVDYLRKNKFENDEIRHGYKKYRFFVFSVLVLKYYYSFTTTLLSGSTLLRRKINSLITYLFAYFCMIIVVVAVVFLSTLNIHFTFIIVNDLNNEQALGLFYEVLFVVFPFLYSIMLSLSPELKFEISFDVDLHVSDCKCNIDKNIPMSLELETWKMYRTSLGYSDFV